VLIMILQIASANCQRILTARFLSQ